MIEHIWYSFPIQLLVNHFKRNHVLLLYWVVLFAAVTQNFGIVLGIPYLFLDPEYLNRVDFYSFLILGVSLGLFTMAFHVTSYIIDGPRFRFLGALEKPFTKFCVNNSIIPLAFLAVHILHVVQFQQLNELGSTKEIFTNVAGLLTGFLFVTGSLFFYFRATNKDIFLVISTEVNKRIKKSGIARSNIMQRLKYDRLLEIRIDNYLSESLRWKKIGEQERFYAKYDKEMITRVFDQNHLNTVTIQISIFLILISMGFFRDIPAFQVPAAASGVFLLTFFIIFSGAIGFWFRKWALTVTILIIIAFNYAVKSDALFANYKAFGLDYNTPPRSISEAAIREHNAPQNIERDKIFTLAVLENWRKKFPSYKKPKLILLGVSGGGQRAALWAFNGMRVLDSLSGGQFTEHTLMITGASGGLVGAAYYRELQLRIKEDDTSIDYDRAIQNISGDILNPVLLTMVVNDLFVRHQKFKYADNVYIKDRGYAFEQQLNKNTEFIMDKRLIDYYKPEYEAIIPMMVLSPTVINGGRKLYMSPFSVSYLNIHENSNTKAAGIDFMRFFENHGAENIPFLTALRMNATFPYITPNVSLPTNPRVEIMDAGISDNFGIADAIQFLYIFKDWIEENTSGVILISIRDSEKLGNIDGVERQTMLQKFFNPVKSIYNNWWSLQDLDNESRIEYAKNWFRGNFYQFTIEYTQSDYSAPLIAQGTGEQQGARRASLNWHLTTLEKQNILRDIYSEENRQEMNRLVDLLKN